MLFHHLLLLLPGIAFQRTEPEQEPGVTVPVDRALESVLEDAERFLQEEEQAGAAVALLQEVLEAGPQVLVPGAEPGLYLGASVRAESLLAGLSAAGIAQRNELVHRRAAAALAEALDPPDPAALRQIAARFLATPVGERAAMALAELELDRGFHGSQRIAAPFFLPVYSDEKDARLPLVDASGLRPLWRYHFRDPRIQHNTRSHRLAFGEGLVYLTNGVEVAALDLGSGNEVWQFPYAPGWDDLGERDIQEIFAGYNPDMLTVPVIEDGILLVVLQEPMAVGRFDEFARAPGYSSIAVRRKLPARRLYAFAADSGELLWRQKVPWLESQAGEPRGMVAAPPAASHGKVFLMVYDAVGTIDVSMVALDLYTGEQQWKTFLVSGQQETNLFGNILREMACQPPAADSERVIVCTNLGTISALDPDNGRSLWTRVYPRTRVHTFQNGLESSRPETFANGPLAYQDDLVVCAPRDSSTALALNAEDGSLLTSWPYADGDYGQLRSLVGVTKRGVWFHGTHLAFLPFPGSGAPTRVSKPLYGSNGRASSRFSAALAWGEALAPAGNVIRVLDPQSCESTSTIVGFPGSGHEMGPLQVAPGLAFILRPGGVTAYSSPRAILKTLARTGADEDSLERILPFLEGVDLSDQVTAERVAERTEELIDAAPNDALAERLRLLAARGRFALAEGVRALDLLQPLLRSHDSSRRLDAAILALDVLERSDPAHSMFEPVLRILENSERSLLHRHDGRIEPRTVTLARAHVLRSGSRQFGSNGHLDALLHLLAMENLDRFNQGSLDLEHWARLQLHATLKDPQAASRLERKARRAFDREAPSDSLMRRFAGTDTAWEWIRQAASAGADPTDLVLIAGWLRNFDWPDPAAAESLIDPAKLLDDKMVARLPKGLEVQWRYDLEGAHLLDMRVTENGGRLLVLDKIEAFLVDLDAHGSKAGSPVRLAPASSLLEPISRRAFVHRNGATIIAGTTWWQLYPDDRYQTLRLPARPVEVQRIGGFVALLFAGGSGEMLLQVRELASGTLLLEETVSVRPESRHRMIEAGGDLYLFQSQVPKVVRVPMFRHQDPDNLALRTSPTSNEMQRALAFPGGLMIPFSRRQSQFLHFQELGKTREVELADKALLRTFHSPGGRGWLTQPTGAGLRDSASRIWWQGAAMDRAESLTFRDLEVRFANFEDYSQGAEDLGVDRMLAFEKAVDGTVILVQIDLPADGPPRRGWSLPLKELRYDRLSSTIADPVATEDGWVLALKLLPDGGRGRRMITLLVDTDGRLRDTISFDTDTTSSLQMRLDVGDGHVLLRHDHLIYLLSKD